MMAGAEVGVGKRGPGALCTRDKLLRSLELKQVSQGALSCCCLGKIGRAVVDRPVLFPVDCAVAALVGELELVLARGLGLTSIKDG